MRFFLSRRPTTKPSPPLLPLPATINTPCLALRAKFCKIACVTAWPARSINVRLGTPYFWIVKRSISRICSAVTTIIRTVGCACGACSSNNQRSQNETRSRFMNTIKKFFHFSYRLLNADDNRAGNDAVADIQLDDLGNLRDRQDV